MADQTTTFGTVVAEEINADPEFRERWERLALARELAAAVLRYRAENDLSQTDLANQLGMKQPQIARLEAAETEPRVETIAKVAGEIGAEIAVNFVPASKASTLLTKSAREQKLVKKYRRGAGTVVVAMSAD